MASFDLHPRWQGLPVVPSHAAAREMLNEKFNSEDILQVLEEGEEVVAKKRADGVVEKCLRKGRRSIKVVVARSCNKFFETDYWVIIHVKSVSFG